MKVPNQNPANNVNKAIDDVRVLQIASRIKELRKSAGFTNYEEFAWEYEIKRAQYWRMEKGTNFTMKSLLKIINAHNISLEDFFKGIK